MSHNDPNLRDPDLAPDLLAHDLRAAVAGVISALGLISGQGLAEGERRSLRQARVAADTLHDLLDISMGRGMAAVQAIALHDLARRIDSRWRDTAEEKGIGLHVHLATDAPTLLFCPRAELHRIFDNVLGNALKYCDEGDVTLAFGSDQRGGLRVTLDDDGPGFSDEALQALFALHGRPVSASKAGTGLGLYITKSLADRMGVEIDVTNRKSGGARIILRFPDACCKPGEGAEHPAPAPRPVNALPDLSALHVLVAEDNLTNQLVVGQMLETMGARFQMASDGVEALELFERQSFDLVLLDIEMPRLTGLDVIRRIRARSDGRETTPLLALTAYAMPDHVRRIRDEGASGLIAKPLTSLADFGQTLLDHVLTGKAALPLAQPAPAGDDLSLIERAVFDSLAQSMGAKIMAELLDKVASDLGDVHEKLEGGRSRQDSDAIRAATHILVSLAGAVGATNLQNFAQMLNAAVKAEPWDTLAPQIGKAIAGVESLLGFVAKEIGNW